MSCLETLRQFFEDIETLEKAISQLQVQKETSTSAQQAFFDNRLFQLGVQMSSRSKQAQDICDDRDRLKQEEVSFLGGNQVDGSVDVWRSFYTRVHEAVESSGNTGGSEYYEGVSSVDQWIERSKELARSSTHFSGEEAFGQFLDMTSLHQQYLNLKRIQEYMSKDYANQQWLKKVSHWPKNQIEPTDEDRLQFLAEKARDAKPIDYVTWLRTFANLSLIPRYLKYKDQSYAAYLAALVEYLTSFCQRHSPLFDIPNFLKETREQFNDLWLERDVEGWEVLTWELPTYAIVTDKLFANVNTLKSHQESKLFRQVLAAAESHEMTRLKSELFDMETALEEFTVKKFAEIFAAKVTATIAEVQRRQSRTLAEISAEIAEAAEAAREDEDNEFHAEAETERVDDGGVVVEGAAVYNPMNLPIGWDGKPIPFWLYKLHGLGEEFKCEICGNFSYWGRKAFEKHFSEWRHVHGLKCLRLQPLPAFDFITSIEEVIALNDKLNHQKRTFNPLTQTECEDTMGNVMNLKSYQDLARQGLI